jgi:uncharacterized protein Usg
MAVKYITRKQLYTERWEALSEIIPLLKEAARNFADGRIQSYVLGHHNITRNFASLKDLLDFLKDCEMEWAELDAILHNRSRRYVEHNYYQNPTNIRFM